MRSLISVCSNAVSLGTPGGNVVTSNSGLIKLVALSPHLVEQQAASLTDTVQTNIMLACKRNKKG